MQTGYTELLVTTGDDARLLYGFIDGSALIIDVPEGEDVAVTFGMKHLKMLKMKPSISMPQSSMEPIPPQAALSNHRCSSLEVSSSKTFQPSSVFSSASC